MAGRSGQADTRPENKGWAKCGGSVADLARELDLLPDRLEETVRRYNRVAVEFGRLPTGTVPLQDLPFYGIPCGPRSFNAQGGPRWGPVAR